MLQFEVCGQKLARTDRDCVAAGAQGTITASFAFDAAWEGKNRTARFTRGDGVFDVLLENDACTVPWEVLAGAGVFSVSVFGGATLTTGVVDVYVTESGILPGALPAEPSPGYFDGILSACLTAAESARAATETITTAAETVETLYRLLPPRHLPLVALTTPDWDFQVTDRVTCASLPRLSVSNVEAGDIGLALVTGAPPELPENSVRSADFDYVTGTTYLYTFFYDGTTFYWNRTVYA